MQIIDKILVGGFFVGLVAFGLAYNEYKTPVIISDDTRHYMSARTTLTNTTHTEAITTSEKLQHALGSRAYQPSAIYVQGEPDNVKPLRVVKIQ